MAPGDRNIPMVRRRARVVDREGVGRPVDGLPKPGHLRVERPEARASCAGSVGQGLHRCGDQPEMDCRAAANTAVLNMTGYR